MNKVETPIERLVRIAELCPDRLAYGYPQGGGETLAARLTYRDLSQRAEMVAAALLRCAKPGDRVLLAMRPDAAFTVSLFGCWRAGMVPVPAYPPRPNRAHDRALSIARSAGARIGLVMEGSNGLARSVLEGGGIHCLNLHDLRPIEAGEPAPPWFEWPADAVHLLQYTSGSTADPKGVAITVSALAANLDAINARLGPATPNVTVTWVPAFHDLGLIQGTIQPIWREQTAYILNAAEFVKHPLNWIRVMSRFRATDSQAPNFAFDLVVRSVKPADLHGLDLSSLRHVIVGAEPIRKPVMDEFLALVAGTGFQPSALAYGYGMAETTLVASICLESPRYRTVDAEALENGTVQAAGNGRRHRDVASCGRPLDGFTALIVDPADRRRLPLDHVGEIWLAGPSLAQGYWQQADATRNIFAAHTLDGRGPFLRTGDLGFLDEAGRIHITGRLKDVLIINGRNHYPHDIEATVRTADPALSDGRGAAFSIETGTRESVAIVHEVRRTPGLDVEEVAARIRHAVADEHEVDLEAIVLVRTGTLPVTSSGKIQRQGTRTAWQQGGLTVVGEWRRPAPRPKPIIVPAAESPVLKRLVSLAAEVSGLPPEQVDPTEPLARLGMGSLQTTRLVGLVESEFNTPVDATAAYTHPTLAQLADLIGARMGHVAQRAVATALGAVGSLGLLEPRPAIAEDAIAIVGMACRLPGAADLDAFWRLLLDGGCAIGAPSPTRADLVASFATVGADVPRRGGFLEQVDGFDPAFFKMSPVEAALVDPQHRLFLEVAWEALEALADSPDRWAGRRVGIFLGLSQTDYFSLLIRSGQASAAQALTGNARNMAPNRLSYLLDLKGPSVVVDTACSSSLVAIATALRSMQAGDCDMAIVGGVNLVLDGVVTESLHRAGMLAGDGACKPFDAAADGYGRGEGCGVVVLKRHWDARASGDHIWGFIAGVGVNQDGLSNGLTAPNGRAQEDVIRAALADAGIGGDAIAYIEAHGTGTPLGDPVEANALAAVLGPSSRGRYAGSVKANIGHLEAAAGIAGLIKATLVLNHRMAPPCVGLRQLNPLIASAARMFELPRSATALPPDSRYAGISSFGFGGTNAHVVLRAPDSVPAPDVPALDGPVALCLSARDETALERLARRWRDTLAQHDTVPARVWAANALRRRTAMRTRLAVIGADAAGLAEALDRWLTRERQAAARAADDPARGLDASDTAAAWLGGGRPDWRAIWNDTPLPLAPLPSYPFQRQRHWVEAAMPAETPSGPAVLRAIPPVGEVESVVTGILGRLLGLDPARIERDEKFIEIGADSIVLARALREIEEAFGVTIGFRQILEETPTIATLAGALAANGFRPPAPARASDREPPRSGAAATSVDQLLAETERTLATLGTQQNRLRQLLASPRKNEGIEGRFPPIPPPQPPTGAAQRSQDDASATLMAELAQRYIPRTTGSKTLAAAARPVLADVRAAAGFRPSVKEMLYPIAVDRAAGARMIDVDGNEYVDIAMGFGVLLFGHGPGFVTQALSAEIARGIGLGPQNRLAGQTAELLCRLTGMERAAFTTTGTEAVMTALRLARAVTGRTKVVIFEGAYHGHFDGVLGVGREIGGRLETLPLAPGVAPNAVVDLIVLPYADDRALEIIDRLGETLAAVLVEPVQSRRPDLQPGPFLQALRRACDHSGTALIFDEMITGFRIAAGGAQAHFGVRADLVTYGKIAGGGMPIGIVAGARRFLDALDGGSWRYGDESGPQVPTTFFAGTFNKHPLAMAGAHAVFSHLLEAGPGVYDRLNATSAALEAGLLPVLARADLGLARFGSLFRFAHAGNADAFFYSLLQRGIYLWEGRSCFLSTAHGPSEIERIVDAVEATVGDLTGRRVVALRAPPGPVPVPLPAAARQMLRLAELASGGWLAYHEAVAVRLPGATAPAAVAAALVQVAARHEALRLVVGEDGTSAWLHPVPVPVPILPLCRLEPGQSLAEILAQARRVPLDRTRPLWRAELIQDPDGLVLLLVVHHAVIDGMSLGMLIDEIVATVSGPADGAERAEAAPSRTDPASVPGDTAWWQQRLRDLPAAPDLPLDRPRPPLPSFAGASVECAIPAELWTAVTRRAAAAEATPHMVLAAAWSATLHRIAGADQMVMGIIASGRGARPGRMTVGNFAQVLPVETRLAAGDDLLAHFRRMRRTLLDLHDRQDVVMAELLEAGARPFDPARPTAIPLVFNFDQAPPATGGWISVPTTHAKFDLALNVIHQSGSATARLDCNTDVFDAATAAAWLGGFIALLTALCLTPERRPAEVWAAAPLATPRRPLPHPSLPDWLAATAGARPDRFAVACGETQVTYGALSARAGSLASAIAQAVADPEQIVAVALTPSIDLPAALWAVHWAGHAYFPLDIRHPAPLLRKLLTQTRTALILTDEINRPAVERLGLPTLVVDGVGPQTPPPPPALTPGRLAYLLQTSGSTGVPKIIGISHGALVNLLASMIDAPGIEPADRLLAMTPLTFDIAALELFLPLVAGAGLIVAPAEVRGDGRALARLAESVYPSIVQATPSVWTLLVEGGWRPPPGLKALVGGEKLPGPLADHLIAAGCDAWNMYGPTETTIWSSCCPIRSPSRIDLGSPVRGTVLTVLDAQFDPVPPGGVGELAIGGAGLARGYWARPDLTAAQFRPDRAGDRLYLTGDLVRVGTDGRIYFLGRRDHQVKIAGHRIELDEIAATIETVPGVARAVALVDGTGAGARLSAHVQPKPGVILQQERLEAALRELLPPHLVPAQLSIVSLLPMTANGKINRAALEPAADAAAAPVAPASGLETRLAAIWAEVLRVASVEPTRSFFALGGTSLMLAHMHLKVTKETGLEFPLVDCVRHPTVRTLANYLGGLARHGDRDSPADLAPAAVRGRIRAERLRRLADVNRGGVNA